MSQQEPRIPHQRPRDAAPAPARRPGPRVVVWGSLSLFAVLFALLTFQLSASPARVASKHDAATARKPAGSEFAETSGTEAEAGSGGAEPAPSEGELETESEEFEAAEAEAAEREAAELELIEAEESAPVVTGAS